MIRTANKARFAILALLTLSVSPAVAAETAGLITVNYARVDSFNKVSKNPQKVAGSASESLGIYDSSNKSSSVFHPRHRSEANKNMILGGPEVIPM